MEQRSFRYGNWQADKMGKTEERLTLGEGFKERRNDVSNCNVVVSIKSCELSMLMILV